MDVTYHLFSKAIRVSAHTPIIAIIDMTHFSYIVPKNCRMISTNPSGSVIIKNAERKIPQNLLNFTGIIWLAIRVIGMPTKRIIIDENEVD
jgi:hypothetical protein